MIMPQGEKMACTKQRIDIYSPVKCIIYIYMVYIQTQTIIIISQFL